MGRGRVCVNACGCVEGRVRRKINGWKIIVCCFGCELEKGRVCVVGGN